MARAGDGRWALGPLRSLVGSRCGCGPGWGLLDRGAQGGLSQRPVGRKKKGGWPGAQKRRDATDRRSGLGDQGSPGEPPNPLGPVARPRPRQGAPRGCPAGEAAGSAEPTPAHTLPESMLSAALGTSCRVASRPGPCGPPSGSTAC